MNNQEKDNIETAKIWGLSFVLIGAIAVGIGTNISSKEDKQKAFKDCRRQAPKDTLLFNSPEMESCLNKRGFTLDQDSYLEKEALEILPEFIFLSEKAMEYAEIGDVKKSCEFYTRTYVLLQNHLEGLRKASPEGDWTSIEENINEMYSLCN